MAGKLQLVSGMADWTAHRITQDAASWKQYLDTASRIYKYSFDDQLLIYAQRPGATACASMDLWNNRMRRWVKGGSKGIALIRHREGGKPYLDYVFDVADTRPVQGARMPYLWKMEEGHHPAILEGLEKKYGRGGGYTLEECLMQAAVFAVQEAAPEYMRDFFYDRRRKPGQEEIGREVEEHFKEVLCASVQYAVLARCGLDAAGCIEDRSFAGIRNFRDPAALYHLGNAVSELSMEILQEIGRIIRNHDREMAEKPRSFLTDREEQKKTLENVGRTGYTGDTKEFNALKRESKEGSKEDGRTDIQGMRGISDTRTETGRGGGTGRDAAGKIRDAAAELPPEAPQKDVHLHAADGQAPAAPAGDRQAGPGAGGQDGIGDDGKGRSGRSAEGAGPDVLGAGGKQLHGAGGRSGAAGNRVQLSQEDAGNRRQPEKEEGSFKERETETEPKIRINTEAQETAGQDPAVSVPARPSVSIPPAGASGMPEEGSGTEPAQLSFFPTVAEQIEHIAMEQEAEQARIIRAASASMEQKVPEVVIDQALTRGSIEEGSILRIIGFYQKSPGDGEAAAFLKKEFGTGGIGIRISGKEYAIWHDGQGVFLAPGRRAKIPGGTLIPWC